MYRLFTLLTLVAAGFVATAGCLPGAQGSARSASTPAATATPVPSATPTPSPSPVPLTLGGLFHPTASPGQDPSHVRTLTATGDVIPARLLNAAATDKHDFTFPFRPTAEYVRSADLTYINLESPLLPGCAVIRTGTSFCGDVRWVDGLKLIGTKVANIANNHVYDGPQTERTRALLEQSGIQVTTDIGPPVVLDVRGLKFAFVGSRAVGEKVDREALKADIQKARQLADVVVVQFHWGKEYVRQPAPDNPNTPDEPVELGHLAVDSGADLVIGNHPHWVQGVEVYKDRLITYAHGNYAFDQVNCYPGIGSDYQTYCSDDTRTSVIGTYTFYDRTLVGVSWKPTFIDTSLQTQWADAGRSQQVLQTMESASRELAQKLGEPAA
jgi:poly-gamma-glutamate capsule biosynthesis protein CapA/YwtB (metallophosphatase superfamily)